MKTLFDENTRISIGGRTIIVIEDDTAETGEEIGTTHIFENVQKAVIKTAAEMHNLAWTFAWTPDSEFVVLTLADGDTRIFSTYDIERIAVTFFGKV